MSLSQTKIINRLLNLANSSKINMRHAAGIYKGSKELFSSVNMERNKFNRNSRIITRKMSAGELLKNGVLI